MALEILLINVHSSHNAGDAALTHVAIAQLKQQFPQSHITLAMDDPDSHVGEGEAIDSFFRLVRDRGRWDIRGLLQLFPATLLPVLSYRLLGRPIFILTPGKWCRALKAYIRADLVVSKPGGFLYSSGRGVSLFISIYTLAMALLASKPVYLLPQSIGPLSRWWEHIALKHVLRRTRIVMVREPISLSQLRAWSLPKALYRLLPDPAFCYPSASETAATVWLQEHQADPYEGIPLMGMTVINWQAQNPSFKNQARYEVACAEAVRLFVERFQGQALLFPQVRGPLPSQDDRTPARRIADRLSRFRSSISLIEEPIPPDLLKSIYGFMTVFIGTRMHSNIFALSQGVPVIAIGYQPKTLGILQMVGLDEWCIGIDEVTAESLTKMLLNLMDARTEVRKHLQHVMPQMLEGASHAGELIAIDFSSQETDSEQG